MLFYKAFTSQSRRLSCGIARLTISAILLFAGYDSSILAAPFVRYQPPAAIAYAISIEDADAHFLHIQIKIRTTDTEPLEFAIPAWTPGYYQILHYENKIERVVATDESGNTLPITHNSQRSWQVAHPQNGLVNLSYSVKADDAGYGFFGSVINENEGYINGASALMYVSGKTDLPDTLTVTLPASWQIACPLSPHPSSQSSGPDNRRYGFRAGNYDELIDCPMQFGHFSESVFQQDGAEFHCVFVGNPDMEKRKIVSKLAAIVHSASGIFGGLPFQHYYFIYHIGNGAEFYGGLEHSNSTVIHLGAPLRSGEDNDFITTSAHEFFHAWNVKRIHPSGLGPFDLTQPVRSPSLWFAEGVTDYYALLLSVRSGLRSQEWLLKNLEGRIAELDRTPARVRVSLTLSGNKAWEGQSAGYDGLSYYLKGSLAGFYFDLRIREASKGTKSLDDVMRLLNQRFGWPLSGYMESDLLKALNTVAGDDLTAEYERYINNTNEFEWNEVFHKAGLSLQREAVSTLGLHLAVQEPPGAPASPEDKANLPVTIDAVDEGLAGSLMGIRSGDRLLRLNGDNVTLNTLPPILRKLAPGSEITLDIQRGMQLLTLHGKTGKQFTNHHLALLSDNQQTADSRRILEGLVRPH